MAIVLLLNILMVDFNPKLSLSQSPNVSPQMLQRSVLVGRVKMAQAIKMPEKEWAEMLAQIERDPLFQELIDARAEGRRVIRFKRFASTQMSSQAYDFQDEQVIDRSAPSPEGLLANDKGLVALIKKIGVQKFEKYFLYRESDLHIDAIANECGIGLADAKRLQDFVINFSVQSEFYHPSTLAGDATVRPSLIGRIIKNDDATYSIAFNSPHLARGLYEIDRTALRRWYKEKNLDAEQSARLRRYIGMLEVSNLKQGAFWRVIDYLLKAQKPYFDSQDPCQMKPLSLRHVARELQFAPSTVSRVFSAKSVMLPWDHEILLTDLMPGQRNVVLNILEKFMLEAKADATDIGLAQQIESSYGIRVSRRTITACRHVIEDLQKPHRSAA